MEKTLEVFINFCDNMQIDDTAFESRLSTAERKALPDNAFGLPEKRKFPLIIKDEHGEYDWSHLKDAIAYFHTCKDENDKKILATNIAKIIKKYNIDINITAGNKIRNYAIFPPSKPVEKQEK